MLVQYDNLYSMFKESVPEGQDFFERREKAGLLDGTDGMHVMFGMVVVPYILHVLQNNKIHEIHEVFSFLEEMATCGDSKVNEILDFTVLEQLTDEGPGVLAQCKRYMGKHTLEHCREVERYLG